MSVAQNGVFSSSPCRRRWREVARGQVSGGRRHRRCTWSSQLSSLRSDTNCINRPAECALGSNGVAVTVCSGGWRLFAADKRCAHSLYCASHHSPTADSPRPPYRPPFCRPPSRLSASPGDAEMRPTGLGCSARHNGSSSNNNTC